MWFDILKDAKQISSVGVKTKLGTKPLTITDDEEEDEDCCNNLKTDYISVQDKWRDFMNSDDNPIRTRNRFIDPYPDHEREWIEGTDCVIIDDDGNVRGVAKDLWRNMNSNVVLINEWYSASSDEKREAHDWGGFGNSLKARLNDLREVHRRWVICEGDD